MKWLILALLCTSPLAAQQQDTAVMVFKRHASKCSDSTAVLLRQVLSRKDKTTTLDRVKTWSPMVLTGITLLVVLFRTRSHNDPIRVKGEDEHHEHHSGKPKEE